MNMYSVIRNNIKMRLDNQLCSHIVRPFSYIVKVKILNEIENQVYNRFEIQIRIARNRIKQLYKNRIYK